MADSITCPICGKTSYNPNDVEQRYCANCHAFWGDLAEGTRVERVRPEDLSAFEAGGLANAQTFQRGAGGC